MHGSVCNMGKFPWQRLISRGRTDHIRCRWFWVPKWNSTILHDDTEAGKWIEWARVGGGWVPNRGKRDIFIKFTPPPKKESLFTFLAIGTSKDLNFISSRKMAMASCQEWSTQMAVVSVHEGQPSFQVQSCFLVLDHHLRSTGCPMVAAAVLATVLDTI